MLFILFTIIACIAIVCLTIISIFEKKYRYLSECPVFPNDLVSQRIGEVMMMEDIEDDEKLILLKLIISQDNILNRH